MNEKLHKKVGVVEKVLFNHEEREVVAWILTFSTAPNQTIIRKLS
jgi:hypothetical protein